LGSAKRLAMTLSILKSQTLHERMGMQRPDRSYVLLCSGLVTSWTVMICSGDSLELTSCVHEAFQQLS
jgi:hypothetical protein